MATILLQAAGTAIGGLFGPVGAAIGAAAGSLAGYAADRMLLDGSGPRRVEGPRLSAARPFTAEEGVPLPRVYGTVRTGGIMIWATRFEEARTTTLAGGKKGVETSEYSYFANVAFALCEGPVTAVRRIWADGREVDGLKVHYRLHRGWDIQPADPLIEARQGTGNAPAYRGTAYVVIEHLPLAEYGNRIPQFQFEVVRIVGAAAHAVRAVSLIPGSTEYGLSPWPVYRQRRPGEIAFQNRHVLNHANDFLASLDDLQASCPNLSHVALVVSWFGSDLRAGSCQIRPAVTTHDGTGLSMPWKVSGTARGAAALVSLHAGGPAYGGTPSDRSVVDAILMLKARGLGVALYPFVMMDVPAGNGLPDPHGGAAQAAYPWRGRITCFPGPAMPGTADRTAAARAQVDVFCGLALPFQFAWAGDTVAFSGLPFDWGYRRFVLHCAALAQAAGGVDAFLIGSELRGLTTLRDGAGAYPFVDHLQLLAADVKAMLAFAGTKVTYGADWTEYFGHQPADGSGDVTFHLDPLWAHPAIDAVGIDNYMPLADWRDGDHAGGNPDGFDSPYDVAGMMGQVAGGEGFDWYYASPAARAARNRTPITDGAHGKPWVFRYKDLVRWWSQPHVNRVGGVETGAPTGWVPRSKPIWFTELGCPAVDKGPNQPNVFPDPKSAESAAPYFSSGNRADVAPLAYLSAQARHWTPGAAGFSEAGNPVSPLYGGRMVDPARSYVWAWDARPYPAFPARRDVWSDGGNWQRGHWLNGRIAMPTVADLINAILIDHGLPPAEVTGAEATVAGYVVQEPGSPREAIDPILDLFGLTALELPDRIAFRGETARAGTAIQIGAMVSDGDAPVIERTRLPDNGLPAEAVLTFRDAATDYQTATVRQRRQGAPGSRQHAIGFPGVLDPAQADALLADWLRRIWERREEVGFAVARPAEDVSPGAIVALPAEVGGGDVLVTATEDGVARRVFARQVSRDAPTGWTSAEPALPTPPVFDGGRPLALFVDLPSSGEAGSQLSRFRVAAWKRPWRSQAVYASPEAGGYDVRAVLTRPAGVGRLVDALPGTGAPGRIDRARRVRVEMVAGAFESVSRARLLAGANSVAILSDAGIWEVAQFQTAEEVEPDVWVLTDLLRGQSGTEDAMRAGAGAGAYLLVLDDALRPAGLRAGEEGLTLNWRVGPTGAEFTADNFEEIAAAGGLRAVTPLAPVHLRARRDGAGGLALSWTRRGRIDADNWLAPDVPLGEAREEYRVEIAPPGGAVLRTATVGAPAFAYGAAAVAADFGTLPAAIDLTVRQLGDTAGWGLPATRRLTL